MRSHLGKLGEIFKYSIRQGQRLLNSLIGLVFLALAVMGALLSYQEWRIYQRTPAIGAVRLAMFAGFTIFLIILGLYSFAKARSVR